MKKSLVILASALVALCACSQQPKLVILHTNDTHSHFEALRGGPDDGVGGVIERAAFVDSIRNAYGADRVLLLHAGDFSQGSSYFRPTRWLPSKPQPRPSTKPPWPKQPPPCSPPR